MKRRCAVLPSSLGFDAFASSSQKQVVLYNLLDWMQSSSVRLIVLGLTSTFTITQKLEKRVASRFSNRIFVLSMPSLEELVGPDDDNAMALLKPYYDAGKSVRWFKRFESVGRQIDRLEPNVAEQLIECLSVRELTLLIAMRRLERKGHAVYSFEMIFDQLVLYYRSHGGQTQHTKLSRTDALAAFQSLVELHFAKPVGNAFRLGGGNKTSLPPEYTVVQMTIDPEHFDRFLPSVACPTALTQWAAKP